MIDLGSPLPEYSLLDQDGVTHDKASLLGGPSVVYFYPKDYTSCCTEEACNFRDRMAEIPGAKVFGVSPDSVKSHAKFAAKFELTFPLLADVDKALCEACGVWVEKSMYGKKYMGVERSTFLLDSEGVVRGVWRKVKVPGHAQEVLNALGNL